MLPSSKHTLKVCAAFLRSSKVLVAKNRNLPQSDSGTKGIMLAHSTEKPRGALASGTAGSLCGLCRLAGCASATHPWNSGLGIERVAKVGGKMALPRKEEEKQGKHEQQLCTPTLLPFAKLILAHRHILQ